MKRCGIQGEQPLRIPGIALDPLPEELRLADGRHAALLGRVDELTVVVVGQALRGERSSRHSPQEQRADGLGMAEREQERQPAAGGAAADEDRQGTEPGEQLVEVVGPDLVLGFLALDDDVGGAAVAAIVKQDAVPRLGDQLGEGQDDVEIAPAPGGRAPPTGHGNRRSHDSSSRLHGADLDADF